MTEKKFKIALMPGDGIGADVVAEAVKVMDAAAPGRFEYGEVPAGAAVFLETGDPLPPGTIERVKEFDAVLLGAMGLPGVRWPNGVEMTPQLDLREQLDLYAGLRPIYLYHPNDAAIKGRTAGSIDILIVRENTEGLFSSRLRKQDNSAAEAIDEMKITRHGAERIARAAFEQAERRRGEVTLVDKANVLPSMAYFRHIFDEVAAAYPHIKARHCYVDAAALYLVREPERFDVLVTENMFGDILSDLAAGLVGGMGMAPSADIGEKYGVFQPSHGSAPDIAGKGIANPIATILSAAMMLEWLKLDHAAARIHQAVRDVLADPAARTPDMGGRMTTSDLGSLIAAASRS